MSVSTLVIGLVAPAGASAVGELTQKPGTAGCTSDDGSDRDTGPPLTSVPGICADGSAMAGPIGTAVSPDGANVYLVSGLSQRLAAFSRSSTGELTQMVGTAGCTASGGGECTLGVGATDIAISADGKNAYVSTEGTIAVFDRNVSTGVLTQKGGAAGSVTCSEGCEPHGIATSRDGRSLYVAASEDPGPGVSAIEVFDRDTSTGALTQKAGTAGCVSDDGTGGACVDGTALSGAWDVAIAPDDAHVYVGTRSSNSVVVLDRAASGALTQKAGTAGCVSETGTGGQCANGTAVVWPSGLALSPRGDTLYTASKGSDAVAVFDVSPDTGALTQKAGTAGCISDTGSSGQCQDGVALGQPTEISASPDGQSVYVGSAGASDAVVIFDRARVGPTSGEITQKTPPAGCISKNGSAGTCQDGQALDGPTWVVTSPDGTSVYSSNFEANSIAIFDRARDTIPPDTTITGPAPDGALTTDSTPDFQFTATEDSNFTCQLDGNPSAVCTSPYTAPAQSDGPHTLTVTATDLALNPDPSPATRTITIDTTAPVTTITSPGVDGSTTDDPTPSFGFSANESATFMCKVDAQAAEGCTSPFTTEPLPDGPHALTVVATDSAGNVEGLPPTRGLTIDTSSSGSSQNVTCHGKEATKIGTGHSETIRGTAKADVIVGEGGDDKLIGADGNDTICGGEGDDKLVGGDGKDALFGEEGDDRLKGGPKHDKLKGGPGHNTVTQ